MKQIFLFEKLEDNNKVKFICLGAVAFLVLVGALGVSTFSSIHTAYSISQFLPEQHPEIVFDKNVRKVFEISEHSTFAGLVELSDKEAGTWLTKERMTKLRDVTEEIATIHGVKKTLSVATVEGAVTDQNTITVGGIANLTPTSQWEKRLLANPLISPNLLSKDGRTILVLIDYLDDEVGTLRLIQSKSREMLSAAFPQSDVKIGGVPAVQLDLTALLGSELQNFVLLSIIGCSLLLFLIFETFSSVVLPLILTAFANIAAIAFMALTRLNFTILSATVPILVFITVVGICVHVQLRVAEEAAEDYRSKISLLFYANQELLLPNLLGSLTTCIGFLTLIFGEVSLIRDYGVSVACSVVISWLVTTVALIPIMYLLPLPKPREWAQRPARWSLAVIQQKRKVVFAVLAACLLMLVAGRHLHWTARLFDDLPPSQEARKSTEIIDEALGGMLPVELVIEANAEDPWHDPTRLKKLEDWLVTVRQISGVATALSLPDFLRSSQDTLPATRAAVSETYFLYSLSPQNPLRNFISNDGKSLRVALRLHDWPGDSVQNLVESLKVQAQTQFPGDQVSVGGMGSLVHRVNNELSRNLIFGFWHALVAICVLLTVIFRSFRWALVACLPNLVPPVMLLGFLALTHTPVKPGIALIFSISLGLAFNNTVYLLNRLKSYNQTNKILPLKKAFFLECNACLISTLIVLVGFGVFLFSHFALNKIFGGFMLVSVLAGLLGDLIFLPALLGLYPRMLNRLEPGLTEENDMITKVAASIALAFVVFSMNGSVAHAATVDENAKQALTKAFHKMKSKDEVNVIRMDIVESDGSKKTRQIELKRVGDGDNTKQYVLAHLQSPPDLRGMGFLSVVEKETENQWVYLPSSKQTRRIVGSNNKDAGILGSDLTYEDLNPEAIRASKISWVKNPRTPASEKPNVIELQLPAGKSRYSKALLYLDTAKDLPVKLEYYEAQTQPVKVITFNDYKEHSGVWRAHKLFVNNLKNKRRTEIHLNAVKINSGLSADDFTPQALADAD